MTDQQSIKVTEEISISATSGVLGLLLSLAFAGGAFLAFMAMGLTPQGIGLAVVLGISALINLSGLFTLEPNQAMVVTFLGTYKGTCRRTGFGYYVPFYSTNKLSSRAENFETEVLKVNDKRGNPIEISAIVVTTLENTARATFDVDDYADYVSTQCETAVREVAQHHPYDASVDEEKEVVTLRGDTEKVISELEAAVARRVARAGCKVLEVRINHLAYAPEIAEAMLRRQQAEATVAARKTIVTGAVGIVKETLAGLTQETGVELDASTKNRLVSDLLVVLAGEQGARPVLTLGSRE